jgi:hypothetical protein
MTSLVSLLFDGLWRARGCQSKREWCRRASQWVRRDGRNIHLHVCGFSGGLTLTVNQTRSRDVQCKVVRRSNLALLGALDLAS